MAGSLGGTVTVTMIEKLVLLLFAWIAELSESRFRTDQEAAAKAKDDLKALGITMSEKKVLTITKVPTLEGGIHVERQFIVDFNKIKAQFLKAYNPYLKKRGKKPIAD